MAGALIVTAAIAAHDLAWLDRLRMAHYPRERNVVRAHLTMFHALPPSVETEIRARLVELTHRPAPRASIEGLMDLGGGVGFRVVSSELDRIRDDLASGLHGLLGAQDSGGWRPHVTIQNKVEPKVARALMQSLQESFVARPLAIRGLALDRYLGGPWEFLGLYSFRGVR